MNRIRWYGPSLVLLLTIAVALVAGPSAVQQIVWAQTDARLTLIRNNLEQNQALAEISNAFRNVAEVVEPSVVHVEVLARAGGPGGRGMPGGPQGPGGMPQDPMDQLREFFGPRFEERFPGPDQAQPEQQQNPYEEFNRAIPRGNGSGWVYDANGHIITNNHVIAGAEEIRVRFQDGRSYIAEVVGTDPNTDVAVLKVDATDLHPMAVSEDAVEPGDIVFAFGSPFGFEFSMSQGVVSAKGRHLNIIEQGYENFIQTDAAINPGNSGGPLTNIYGQVIGMNTAIASRARSQFEAGFMGLGFAIPVNMVTRVVDQLIAEGRVSRGFLGIYIQRLEPRLARTFGFEGDGVLVAGPTGPDSPAAEAGIQPNDIVTHINEQAVSDPDEFRYLVAGFRPGTEIEVRVFRDGETLTLPVTLGELPGAETTARSSTPEQAQPGPGSQGSEALQKYGIESVETFSEQAARSLGVRHREGVLVTRVRRGSIAEGEGFSNRLPMLIVGVQSQPVRTAEELAQAVEQQDPSLGFRMSVLVWNPQARDWTPRVMVFELPQQ